MKEGGAPAVFLTARSSPQIPSELITLDPTELGRVDPISLEQQRQERAERLVRVGSAGRRP